MYLLYNGLILYISRIYKVKKSKILFELEERLKNAFQERIETSVRAGMSEVLRGCIFFMLNLSRSELRDFVHRCENLEFQYYDIMQGQGDAKAKIMEDREKMKDTLAAAFDDGLIDFDFRKGWSEPSGAIGIEEVYELLKKYKSKSISVNELKKSVKELDIKGQQDNWREEHKE